MSSPRGWVLTDGTVVNDRRGRDAVAELFYKETRYNLRRVLVSRQWYALLGPDRTHSPYFGTRTDTVNWVRSQRPPIKYAADCPDYKSPRFATKAAAEQWVKKLHCNHDHPITEVPA